MPYLIRRHRAPFAALFPRARLGAIPLAVLATLAAPLQAPALTWSSGDYAASGLPTPLPAGVEVDAVTGPLPSKFFGSSTTIDGRLNWLTADGLGSSSGAVVTLRGLFDIRADSSMGGGGSLDNFGAVRKTAGSGTWSFSVPLLNRSGGVLAAESGTLQYRAASVFESGSVFEGAGRHLFSSGATQVFSFQGDFDVAAGTVFQVDTFAHMVASGASPVRPRGDLQWSGGGSEFRGAWGIRAGHMLTATGSGSKGLAGALEVDGGVAWNASAPLSFSTGGQLKLNGVFDLQTDAGFSRFSGSGGIENLGTLRKSGGGGVSQVNVGLLNRAGGVLDARSGTLQYRAASTFEGGTRFQGGGRHLFEPGTFTFQGDFGVEAGTVLQIGGSAIFASGGDATVRPLGDLLWTGGGSELRGSWGIRSGQRLLASDAGSKNLGGLLEVDGTVTWEAGTPLTFVTGGDLRIRGLYDIRTDMGFSRFSGSGSIENLGTLRKSGGEGISSVSIALTNRPGGVLDAAIGTLQYRSASHFDAGSVFAGAGRHLFASGASQTFSFGGDFIVTPGTTFEIGAFAVFDNTSGGVLRPQADLLWSGGGSVLRGQWTVREGQTLRAVAGGSKSIDGTLVNEGTVVWATTDGINLIGAGTLRNEGRFEVLADTATPATTVLVTNEGLWRKAAGSGEFRFRGTLVNTGTLDAASGSIRVPDNWRNDGRLEGTARFNASRITNAGTVAPGNADDAIAVLTFSGALVQAAGSRLSFQLGAEADPAAASALALVSDRLVVVGALTPGGVIELQRWGDYRPSVGDSFRLIDWGSLAAGSFALDGSAFGSGVVFETRVVAGGLEVQVTAVPEPAAWLLMALGLPALLALLARRRGMVRAG